jgi:protein-tyrosine phosphatase
VLDRRLWISGSPIDWEWVHETGITVVTDVADPGPAPSPDAVGAINYLKDPLVDATELPPRSQLQRLVRRTCTAVRIGQRALVACTFGKNRSGLVVALCLRELYRCTGPQALDVLRKRRHRAVNNATFADYVSRLGRPERLPDGPPGRPSGPSEPL